MTGYLCLDFEIISPKSKQLTLKNLTSDFSKEVNRANIILSQQ